MSIADQITRLTQCREDIYTALSNKGVSGWTDTTNKFANVPDYINAIQTGDTTRVTYLESALEALTQDTVYSLDASEEVSIVGVPYCKPLLAFDDSYRALYHPSSVSTASKYMSSSSSTYVAKLWRLTNISYNQLIITHGGNGAVFWPISAELGEVMWKAGFYGELATTVAESQLSVSTASGTLDFGHSSFYGDITIGSSLSFGSQTQLGRDYILGIYYWDSTNNYALMQSRFNIYARTVS